MKNKRQFLDSFVLKLIAAITMTLDHIGIGLTSYFANNLWQYQLGYAFRIIGRISFPIFIFLLIVGAFHTHNIKNYLIRLGSAAILMMIPILIIQYTTSGFNSMDGNIFLSLFLIMLTIFFLQLKGKFKYFAFLPFIYVTVFFIFTILNKMPEINISYPLAIAPEYDLYGYLMGMAMYFMVRIYNSKVKKACEATKMNIKDYKDTPDYKRSYNLLCICVIAIIALIFFFLKYISPYLDVYNDSLQSYCIISIIFILFYNHKLGYNNKIIQYSFYAYYPVHIAIIFGIFMLTFGY